MWDSTDTEASNQESVQIKTEKATVHEGESGLRQESLMGKKEYLPTDYFKITKGIILTSREPS